MSKIIDNSEYIRRTQGRVELKMQDLLFSICLAGEEKKISFPQSLGLLNKILDTIEEIDKELNEKIKFNEENDLIELHETYGLNI